MDSLSENKFVPSPSLSPSIFTPNEAKVEGKTSSIIDSLEVLTGLTAEFINTLYKSPDLC